MKGKNVCPHRHSKLRDGLRQQSLTDQQNEIPVNEDKLAAFLKNSKKLNNISVLTPDQKRKKAFLFSQKVDPYTPNKNLKSKLSKKNQVKSLDHIEQSGPGYSYEFDKIHSFPKQGTDQVASKLNQKILELELELEGTRYLLKNQTKDLESRLAFAYRKNLAFEQRTPYSEVFELYNKESRNYEKEIELLRTNYLELIAEHETSYNEIMQTDNASKKEKLLIGEMRALQHSIRKAQVDLKTKETELNALKAKEKAWTVDHKDLDSTKKNVDKFAKELVRSEVSNQSKEQTIGGAGKALTQMRRQYTNLELKNKENEKLISALQSQINRLNLQLQSPKVDDKLDRALTRRGDESAQPEIELPAECRITKQELVKAHNQIKKCKMDIAENLKKVKDNANENTDMIVAAELVGKNVGQLYKILSQLELRELNYINALSQITGKDILNEKSTHKTQ